jgi:hypothetical protein
VSLFPRHAVTPYGCAAIILAIVGFPLVLIRGRWVIPILAVIVALEVAITIASFVSDLLGRRRGHD